MALCRAGEWDTVTDTDTDADTHGDIRWPHILHNFPGYFEWNIQYSEANNRDSIPFIASNHFMDMLFDGGTPGVAAPTHTQYASMSMSPKPTVDMSNAQILHMTMEVHAHQNFRRPLGFKCSPSLISTRQLDAVRNTRPQYDTGAHFQMSDIGTTWASSSLRAPCQRTVTFRCSVRWYRDHSC